VNNELDLDALERDARHYGTLDTAQERALIAELRACRAERDALLIDKSEFVSRRDAVLVRAERAEARIADALEILDLRDVDAARACYLVRRALTGGDQ